MKTRDLALGGILAALFIVVSYVLAGGNKSVQVVIDIVRIVIVAIYSQPRRIGPIAVFSVTTLTLSFLLLPIILTFTNVITSIFLGIIIGKMVNMKSTLLGCLFSVLGNTVAFVYSVVMYDFLTGINLFSAYKEQYANVAKAAVIANEELRSITESFMSSIDFYVALFLFVDLLLSAIISYFCVKLIIKRMKKILMRGRG